MFGIVVIIDLLHSDHTVMGKCQNWSDQRHRGSTVGTFDRSAAAGNEEGGEGGGGGMDGGRHSQARDVFSLALSDGTPCLRRLPPCQSFLFTTLTHWDSESCQLALDTSSGLDLASTRPV